MNQKILEELGSMDLIDMLVKGTETMSERVERLKQLSDAQLNIQSQTLLDESINVDFENTKTPVKIICELIGYFVLKRFLF